MKILKQSTAATPGIGPFVDTSGAAVTTTNLLIQTDVVISKGGSATYAAKNDASSSTHRANGTHTIPLDTTDTNTLGTLTITVNKSGTLPVRDVWTVVPANVYDSLVSTDKLQVDTVELNSVAASAANLEKSARVIIRGTVDHTAFTATTTIFESDDVTEATTDHYKGRVVVFTSGTVEGQASAITAYSQSAGRGRFTVNALTELPPDNVQFVIV